jgi:4-amino-4-deoxy-L-arabinose transferase-like glycosyltransferase
MKKTNSDLEKFFRPFTLTIISFLFAVVGQHYLYMQQKPVQGIIFFILAIVIFICADIFNKEKTGILFERFMGPENKAPQDPEQAAKEPRTFKKEVIFLLAIVIISIFFRFYKLDQVPPGFWRDEGDGAYNSYLIMKGENTIDSGTSLPVYLKTLVDNPALINYGLAAWYKIFGVGPVESRTYHAFFGVLSVISLFFLLRMLFGRWLALVGALYFAFLYYSLIFSRIVFHAGLAPFFMIFMAYYFFLAMKKPTFMNFALLGVAVGLNFYPYQSGKAVAPVMFVLLCAIFVYNSKFIKSHILKILVAGVLAAAIFMPLGNYMFEQKIFGKKPLYYLIFSEQWMQPFYQKAVNDKAAALKKKNPAAQVGPEVLALTKAEKIRAYVNAYLTHASNGFLMFNMRGDPLPYFNGKASPYADFFTGIFAFLGFGYLLYRAVRGSFFSAATLIIFVSFLHGGILLCCAPHGSKSAVSMPFLAIFCTAYFARALSHLNAQFTGKPRAFFIVLFSLITLFAAAESYNKYFVSYGQDAFRYRNMESWRRYAAELLLKIQNEGDKKGERWIGVMPYDELLPSAKIVLAKSKRKDYELFMMGKNFPAPKGTGFNYVYIFDFQIPNILPAIRAYYPQGEFLPVYEPDNPKFMSFFAYKVPNAQVEAFDERNVKNGLKLRVTDRTTGKLVATRIDPIIYNDTFFDGNNGTPYRAEWTGYIDIDHPENYQFCIDALRHLPYELVIGTKSVIYNNPDAGRIGSCSYVFLEKGRHRVKITLDGFANTHFHFQWRVKTWDFPIHVPTNMLFPN